MIWVKKVVPKPVELPNGVSIVVALRNEESNINRLLESLLKQKTSFPIEFILIDDDSTDNTLALLNSWQNKDTRIKVIEGEGEGKKAAVQLAVKKSRYELVMQTDADCYAEPFWVMSSVTRLLSNKSRLILGPVYPFKTGSFLNGLIRLEWLAMQFLTALTARLKHPGMANGANLLFYKEDYLSFGESEYGKKYASGDDMFFLRYLKKQGKLVGFNLDKNALIQTEMPETLGGLFDQRVRWATKAGKTTNGLTYFFTLIVALANFAWIGAAFLVKNDLNMLPILIICIGWKLTADFIISWNMARFYDDHKALRFVPVMFFIYPVYLLLGLLLSFKKSYAWKGRVTR